MTTAADLKQVMDQYLGGSETRYQHWANKQFIMSEGLRAVAQVAGAHWWEDVLALEVAPLVLKAFLAGEHAFGIVQLAVSGGKATAHLSLEDDAPPAWSKTIDFTDFPDGEWSFYLGIDEGPGGFVVTGFIPQEY